MKFKQKQWSAVFVCIACIEAALLYKLIAGEAQTNQTELIIAICIVGVLVMLLPKLDSLSSVKLGSFKAELKDLKKKTADNEQTLSGFIILSMGPDTYLNLKKLAHGDFGEYVKEPHMGLETELYYLRNLGYISLNTEKARSIYEIPEKGDQLSDYIKVTEEGRKYIELRNNI